MPNMNLHEFTVQESQNHQTFLDYAVEEKTMDGNDQEYSDWSGDTGSFKKGPAKEILIYAAVGSGVDDTMHVYLKPTHTGAYGTGIKIDHSDLPLKISGMLIDRVKINTLTGDNDVIAILSFH